MVKVSIPSPKRSRANILNSFQGHFRTKKIKIFSLLCFCMARWFVQSHSRPEMHRSALSCNRGVVFSLISICRKLLGPINRPIKIGIFSKQNYFCLFACKICSNDLPEYNKFWFFSVGPFLTNLWPNFLIMVKVKLCILLFEIHQIKGGLLIFQWIRSDIKSCGKMHAV